MTELQHVRRYQRLARDYNKTGKGLREYQFHFWSACLLMGKRLGLIQEIRQAERKLSEVTS